MSPRTSVRYGFSRVTDDGKIVSIWNFGDLEDALNCIDSPRSDLSIENVENVDDGSGLATAAQLQDLIPRNLADELGAEGDSLVVQRDQASSAIISHLESVDRSDRSDIPVYPSTGVLGEVVSESLGQTLGDNWEESSVNLTVVRHLPFLPRLQTLCGTSGLASYWTVHSGLVMEDCDDLYSDMPQLEHDNSLPFLYSGMPTLESSKEMNDDYTRTGSSNMSVELQGYRNTTDATHMTLFSNLLLLHLLISKFEASPQTHYLLFKRMFDYYFDLVTHVVVHLIDEQ